MLAIKHLYLHNRCYFFWQALLVLLFSSDACMLHVQTCIVSTIWYVICSSTSVLNTKGSWEVTDVREDRKIYSGYAERFRQTIVAQVCGVFDHAARGKKLVVIKLIFGVLKSMCEHLRKVHQQVSDKDRQYGVTYCTFQPEALLLLDYQTTLLDFQQFWGYVFFYVNVFSKSF